MKKLVLPLILVAAFTAAQGTFIGTEASAVSNASSNTSNASNSSNTSNTADPVIKDIMSVNDRVKSYESEVSVEAQLKDGAIVKKEITVYMKDKRIYDDKKKIKNAHLFFQSNNEKDETQTHDYLFQNGKIYIFDGTDYNLIGETGDYNETEDSNYWNILKPLYDNAALFKKSEIDTNLVFSYEGNDAKVYSDFSGPFDLRMDELESGTPKMRIIYTFDSASLLPISVVAELSVENLATTDVKAFFTSVNGVEDIIVPEGVQIKE